MVPCAREQVEMLTLIRLNLKAIKVRVASKGERWLDVQYLGDMIDLSFLESDQEIITERYP